jgi:hypothetical protein
LKPHDLLAVFFTANCRRRIARRAAPEDRAHTQSWTTRIALSGRRPRRTYPASLEIVWLDLLPQPLEPMPGNAGVMGGVLGISVTEVILHRPQISALIGQVVVAGVAEHVRPHAPELCSLASDPHDIIDGLADELCVPLGHEQPRQIVLPGGEVLPGSWNGCRRPTCVPASRANCANTSPSLSGKPPSWNRPKGRRAILARQLQRADHREAGRRRLRSVRRHLCGGADTPSGSTAVP